MNYKIQNKINQVCYKKIGRLKDLSKNESGRQFLHYSTLSGYLGGCDCRIDSSDRLRGIAERGIISSKQLNKEIGSINNSSEQGWIDLLPDFQPIFEISGNAKAIYIIDPEFISKERQEIISQHAKEWKNGNWYKKIPAGFDLCEYFEISSRKNIPTDYILGLILGYGRNGRLIDSVVKYQDLSDQEKIKMIKELPGNYTFLSVFEEKPENSFPIFSGGIESRVIDPEGILKYEGNFINLEKMLTTQIFPNK